MMGGDEQPSPCDGPLYTESGEREEAATRRGDPGGDSDGILVLCQANGKVSSFNYLGSLLTATSDEWPTVIANICTSRKIWSCLAWILGREGADTKTLGCFYVASIQAILLFRSEMWVETSHIK